MPKKTPSMMLVVEGDHNDADYIVSVTPTTEEELERFLPLIAAIKNFKPYTTTDPLEKHPELRKPLSWKHNHNWPNGDYGHRPDLGEKSIVELYSSDTILEGLIREFDETYVPHAEGWNIHTINNIYVVKYEKYGQMTPLEKAIELAVHAHADQMDEDGMPHIVHCIEVMLAVKTELGSTYDIAKDALAKYTAEELLVASVLHDVVEDTNIELWYIEGEFGANVGIIVDALTRRKLNEKEKETYRDFIYRARRDPGAKLIKAKDLFHNYSRTHKISAKKAKWRKKLEYKYSIAMRVIALGHTWEQASWRTSTKETDGPMFTHYFVADPNGKEIEVEEKEFKKLVGTPECQHEDIMGSEFCLKCGEPF